MKRKPPLPKTPNKLSRQQWHDDVDADKNNALLVEVPAPATPRMGNKQYNDVVSVSRALSIRESIVPEDIHANSIWEKNIPRTQNTPSISRMVVYFKRILILCPSHFQQTPLQLDQAPKEEKLCLALSNIGH